MAGSIGRTRNNMTLPNTIKLAPIIPVWYNLTCSNPRPIASAKVSDMAQTPSSKDRMPPTPIPSIQSGPASPSSPARMVVGDDPTLIPLLYREMIERSGLSGAEVARRMGSRPQAIDQYKCGYKSNPGLRLTARVAQACGAQLVVEFPKNGLV